MIDGRYPVTRSSGRCAARDIELLPGTSCVATLILLFVAISLTVWVALLVEIVNI